MGASVRPEGQVHVLGESRVWPALAIPLAATALLIVLTVAFGFVYWPGFAALAGSLVIALVRRRHAVLADDRGLLIRHAAGLRRSYDWSEIDRMAWADGGIWGNALQVWPRGDRYDTPGPNSPVRVAAIWRPRRKHLPDPLPGLIHRHGIKSLLDP